jgi:hypothetical protein
MIYQNEPLESAWLAEKPMGVLPLSVKSTIFRSEISGIVRLVRSGQLTGAEAL